MSEIDWDKAPAHATHWFPGNAQTKAGWIYQAGNEFYSCYADIGVEHIADFPAWRIARLIQRPSPAWSGEGLPPAGSVLEYMWNYKPEGSEYVQVEILVHDKGNAVMRTLDGPDPGVLRESRGGRCGTDSGQPIFRPIRTPEQIAADEREVDIEQMWKVFYDTPGLAKEGIEALYDAGWRKQPKP